MDLVVRDAVQQARVLKKWWSAKAAKAEVEILRNREGWFDNLHLSPVERVEQFAWSFTLQTRVIIRAYLNDAPAMTMVNGTVRDWNPIKSGDIFEENRWADQRQLERHARKITALIRARQWCDQMAIPYEVAVHTALHEFYFSRSYLRTHRTIPCPSMINGDRVRQMILVKWAEMLSAKIQAANDPRFVIVGPPSQDQVRHEAWLLDQIERRPQPKHALRTYLSKGLITQDSVDRRAHLAMA